MRKVFALVALVCLAASIGRAQNSASPTPNPFIATVPADAATGTTQYTLTKQNTSGNYLIMATSDICGYRGVALQTVQGGSVDIATMGLVYLKMDASSTVGDIVIPSITNGGFGHDFGSLRPASACVVGVVQQAISSSLAQVWLFMPEVEGHPPLVAPNDGTTGTTLYGTGKENTAGNLINAATTDTGIPTYPVIGGAGTSGNGALAISGLAPCTMDATLGSAGGFYVINSTTTAHDCHPQSAAPTPGTWVIGFLRDASTTSGSTALVNVNGFIMPPPGRDVKIIPFCMSPGGTASAGVTYAAGQWTPTNRVGTNNIGCGLQAAPSAGAALQFLIELPKDWNPNLQPYIDVHYASGANTAGTVIWTVSSACTKQDGSVTDDPTFNAESAFGSQTMAVANRSWGQNGQFTLVTSGNNCIPGSPILMKVALSGTATSSINAYQAIVTIPTTPVIQAE